MLQFIKKYLPESKNKKNVILLTSGAIIGQGVVILASPLITRLYSPEEMGLFAVFSSLVSVLYINLSAQFELSIPLPKEDKDAFSAVLLSVIVATLMTLIFSAILFVFSEEILSVLNASPLKSYLWLLPFVLISFGLARIFTFWSIRQSTFKINACARVFKGIFQVAPQVLLGALNVGFIGLIIGQFVGVFINACILLQSFKKKLVSFHLGQIRNAARIAKEYKRFPLYSTGSTMVNNVAANLPVLMLSFSFGAVETGYYALSFRILQLPLRFISEAISQVFLSIAAKAHQENGLKKVSYNIFSNQTRIGLPIIATIAVISPELFAVCFGAPWAKAGLYSQLLFPWLFFSFISTTLSNLVSILQEQKKELVFQVIYILLVFLSLCSGYVVNKPVVSIGLLGLFGGLVLMSKIFWLLMLVKIPVGKSALLLLKEFAIVAPFALTLYLLKLSFGHSKIIIIGLGMIFAATILLVNFKYRIKGDARE